jgi:hypothetical protein
MVTYNRLQPSNVVMYSFHAQLISKIKPEDGVVQEVYPPRTFKMNQNMLLQTILRKRHTINPLL